MAISLNHAHSSQRMVTRGGGSGPAALQPRRQPTLMAELYDLRSVNRTGHVREAALAFIKLLLPSQVAEVPHELGASRLTRLVLRVEPADCLLELAKGSEEAYGEFSTTMIGLSERAAASAINSSRGCRSRILPSVNSVADARGKSRRALAFIECANLAGESNGGGSGRVNSCHPCAPLAERVASSTKATLHVETDGCGAFVMRVSES
eukprot:CAMPEP_0181217226 /NCGR_PEP_ID=MMETSP1096-20121128/27034_1 /TAXON_ID=156174 ORGANISM="Chrysochromulina ericina, Strain CCMP281" /NCGR_SAMPLE_ID=MMETSP1096 /ASSEMBLY_ACC=CAM_ASM_000453 /LENGTH=207 /DNA_ID=CAMNT_0023309335 /DNA_START=345 /DNA_END=969 /DNA_ORIENTATION=-